MRLFLGVGISDELRVGLAAAQQAWREIAPRMKWVNPDLFHLTLQFIGVFPDEELPLLRETLRSVASDPFRVKTGELMTLPSGPGGRVLALSLAEGGEELTSLAAAVMQATAVCGVRREKRPFTAHLTLARAERGGYIAPEVQPTVLQAPILPTLSVSEFNLYASRLHANGPEYEVIEAFRCEGRRDG
ncbi:MAG: RNA 2',3'-cyclic phosphodiesterase [bacterium]|nr:RNA 2',3'-cyclic phosphodiesterase [bacterium]